MSKRFGRNQKRKLREEITLQKTEIDNLGYRQKSYLDENKNLKKALNLMFDHLQDVNRDSVFLPAKVKKNGNFGNSGRYAPREPMPMPMPGLYSEADHLIEKAFVTVRYLRKFKVAIEQKEDHINKQMIYYFHLFNLDENILTYCIDSEYIREHDTDSIFPNIMQLFKVEFKKWAGKL